MKMAMRVINSVAPIRVCDNGGWTDTWFAEHGKIFNIGVYPYVEVQIAVYPRGALEHRVLLHAENFGDRYAVLPRHEKHEWIHHPLLEAAIDYMGVPEDLSVQISIYSEAPAGCSTGTSAAVSVALIGALDQLTPGRRTPLEVAYAAHRIETDMLNQQSGIQDQLCAAYGGINYIEMFDYPYAAVSQILVSNAIWWELERRLCLVFLGRSHSSSDVHEMVIRSLTETGPDNPKLEALRATAGKSRDAIYAGDLGLGSGDGAKHRRAAQSAPRADQHRGAAGDRHRPRVWRPGLEGEWRGRRGWLNHAAQRPLDERKARSGARHRRDQPAVPGDSYLSQPLWAACLEPGDVRAAVAVDINIAKPQERKRPCLWAWSLLS